MACTRACTNRFCRRGLFDVEKIPYGRAIALQPALLGQARAHLVQAAAALAARVDRRQVVGLIGIGASYCAALSAEYLFRRMGVRAVALDAGQLYAGDVHALADAYVAISASGRSLETVGSLRRMRASEDALLIGVTAQPSALMADVVDVEIPCGVPHDSVPATTSYVGSLQALALIAVAWADEDVAAAASDWAQVPNVLGEHIETTRQAATELAKALAGAESVDLVGDPVSMGAAAEGLLLFREATRIPAAWFDSRSYLHGPMEPLQQGRAVIVLGEAAESASEVVLARATDLGSPVAAITVDVPAAGVPHLPVPSLHGPLVTSMFEVVTLQVLTHRCSELLGLTSGNFRYPQPQVKLEATS